MPTGVAPFLVERTRLHARFEQVYTTGVVAVVGPAGGGKTVAAKSWASATTAGDVAWLTAAPQHRDTRELTGALVEAVAKAADIDIPADRDAVHGVGECLSDALVESARPVVIVIDDIEVLDAAVSLEVLRQLIASDALRWKLVLVGRWVPDIGLDALRSRGRLTTISAIDLALTEPETGRIVRTVSGEELGDRELADIHDVIGGWALGATLAGLALRGRDGSGLVTGRQVEGHRYFDQLFADGVFDRTPPDVQRFLLDTSVLHLLHPHVCRELTGRTDATAVLRDLERRNVFTEWLGGRPPVFRYHHMLRSWLRQRLEEEHPGRAADLSSRAAKWYEDHGQHADAIEYWLQAGEHTAARSAIVAFGPQALAEGRYDATISWIETLPLELVTSSRPLLVLLAEAAHRVGRLETLTAVRAIGERLVDRDTAGASPSRFEVTVSIQHSRELHRSGRLVDAADAARRIVAMIDFEAEPVRTGHVGFDDVVLATELSTVAMELLFVGDWDGCRHLSRWIVDTYPTDDPAVAPARISSLGKLAIIEVLIGARRAAATLATEAIALCSFLQVTPADLGWSQAALLVADPPADRARFHQDLERVTRRMDLRSHTCLSDLLRAWAYARDGELASARRVLDRAERSRASLAQPGMLFSLERRVRTIVESGDDEPVLGAREIEVLAALAAGRTRREAAEQLHLSLNTVKTYARRAYRCLGVTTLSEAIEKCSALGVDLEGDREADTVAAFVDGSPHGKFRFQTATFEA